MGSFVSQGHIRRVTVPTPGDVMEYYCEDPMTMIVYKLGGHVTCLHLKGFPRVLYLLPGPFNAHASLSTVSTDNEVAWKIPHEMSYTSLYLKSFITHAFMKRISCKANVGFSLKTGFS